MQIEFHSKLPRHTHSFRMKKVRHFGELMEFSCSLYAFKISDSILFYFTGKLFFLFKFIILFARDRLSVCNKMSKFSFVSFISTIYFSTRSYWKNAYGHTANVGVKV